MIITDSRLCLANLIELDDAASLRACALEQDFCQLDLAGGFKELNQVFVCG